LPWDVVAVTWAWATRRGRGCRDVGCATQHKVGDATQRGRGCDVSSVPRGPSERLQNPRMLETLKEKGSTCRSRRRRRPPSGGLCSTRGHKDHGKCLQVTMKVTVKVTGAILTALAPRTRWHPSIRSLTHFGTLLL
jgi:hypothetical protein